MRGRSAGVGQAVVLVIISCLPILGTLLIAPVLPEMARHFAAVPGTEYLIPFVQTAPALVLAMVGTFAGNLACRIGRKKLLLWAMVLYFVAAPAPLYLDSLYWIIASRLVVGLAEAAVMTTATTLISDYFEGAKRDRYLGLQVLASSCSAVVFITAGGFLGTMGWRVPFFAYLLPGLLIPLAMKLLWEPEYGGDDGGNDGANFPWRGLLKVIAVTFVAGMGMNLMSVEIGFIVDGLGEHRSSVIGLVAALNSLGIVAGSLAFGSAPWIARSRFALAGAIMLAAAGYLLLHIAQSTAIVAIAGAVAGVGCGMFLPWLLAEANRRLGFRQRGKGNGLWISSYYLAVVTGPLVATSLAGVQGGLQAAMLTFSIVLAGLALLVPMIFHNRSSVPS